MADRFIVAGIYHQQSKVFKVLRKAEPNDENVRLIMCE